MSLVSCVYCNTQISEHAVQCPKCGNSEPTNMNKKKLDEKVKYLENRKKQYLPFTISCEECNHNIEIENFSYVGQKRKCPTYGFPKNVIKCFACGSRATDFDPETEQFYCSDHTVAVCTGCGKFIRGKDRKNDYCINCYNIKWPPKPGAKKKVGCLRWFGLVVIIYIVLYIISLIIKLLMH